MRTFFAMVATSAAVAGALFGLGAPQALAVTTATAEPPTVHGNVERICDTPDPEHAACLAVRRTDTRAFRGLAKAGALPEGLGPAEIQDAYDLAADGGAGQTIAIVDAFDDPTAEVDLGIYRAQYGLPACTSANGCFRKVDQRGGTEYPEPDTDWAGEISLDLDMVSAAAPSARILLVEADDSSPENLAAAVDQAIAMGAKFVSNSYGAFESAVDTTMVDAAYNHPGVAIVAAAGDEGYGVLYPAASQYVTAVGGTALVRDPDSERGWSETAWTGTGSGCSEYQPKPDFQNDTLCEGRTVVDVAALADPETGAAVYQTYGNGGWTVIGGTSASAPIIAGVYAQAGTPEPGTYPNSYPYAAGPDTLHDITAGTNGACDHPYLCNATAGYDGPTGVGTPNGPAAFRSGPHGKLHGTVLDAAEGSPVTGAEIHAGNSTAYTGPDGTYKLSLPAGTYDITVGGYGYRTKTFAEVKVVADKDKAKDLPLTALPTSRVSGTVKDGSGHDWPLYAMVSVDGKPGSPVWTDPVTGAYSIDLPRNADYTLRVIDFYPGYEQAVRTVKVATSDVGADFGLKVDPRSGAAPGYDVTHEGPTESFDSTSAAPEGWSVRNAEGTTGGWAFDDPRYRGNHTGGGGGFAIADSGYGVSADTSLISPSYDFSGDEHPDLSFQTQYLGSWSQQASVDVSTDQARTWTTVWEANYADISGPARIGVDLSAYAGRPDVRVRFHFVGSDSQYWELDDVQVADWKAVKVAGGLVTGQVTDANTGEGIVGADVTAASGQRAISVTTPADVRRPDGFFWMFAPKGKQDLTASKKPYQALTGQVKVVADGSAAAGDFVLKAGKVSVTADGTDASVKWGASATRTLRVTNTGDVPAHVTLVEHPGGAVVAAGRAAAGPAWHPAPDVPTAVIDGLADSYQGKLYAGLGSNGKSSSRKLMVYDPKAGGAWSTLAPAEDARTHPTHGFIDGKLYVVGGIDSSYAADGKLEIYDPATDTWTTGAGLPNPLSGGGGAVLNGKLYMIGGCSFDFSCGQNTAVNVYDPATDTWSTAADYPEPVAANACAGIDNKIYCAGGNGNVDTSDTRYELSSAYVYDPASDSWSRLPDMPFPLWRSAHASANGQLVMTSGQSQGKVVATGLAFDPKTSSWSELPALAQARTAASGATGFYAVGGMVDGVPVKSTELLPGYDQPDDADVTWMSVSERRLDLQPGASATVTVTLDASVAEVGQPGTYSARLNLGSDTPYPAQDIPVSLTVAPPASWGKLTGTVTSAATGKPIAGATVEVDSWVADTTLTTGEDGRYELWLDKRNNPLSVIVFKDGYKPATATIKVVKGEVVVTDFALKKV